MKSPENTTQETSPGRFPFLSILAIFFIPLVAYGSIPFWIWEIKEQIKNTPTTNYAPDPDQFAGIAITVGAVLCGSVAAFVGLGITWLAAWRNEDWRWIRILAWLVNGLGGVLAIAVFIDCLKRTH